MQLRAWCQQVTPHGVGASATAHLRYALVIGNYCFLHLAFVLGLRHIFGAASREVSTAFALDFDSYVAWATAQLRCAFALGNYCLLHLVLVLGLRPSYGALSRLVSTAYSTWRWFLGIATVRLCAWCLQLSPRGDGAWDTAQLRCGIALGVYSLLHLALVLGI